MTHGTRGEVSTNAFIPYGTLVQIFYFQFHFAGYVKQSNTISNYFPVLLIFALINYSEVLTNECNIGNGINWFETIPHL